MSELKQGDKAWVSNLSEDDAINMKMERVFVVNYGCVNYCDRYDGIGLFAWNHAVKIPEPKTIPFTAETFPFGEVWAMNQLHDVSRSLIAGVSASGIYNIDGFTSFEDLLDIYTISLDGGKTWQVAGEE